MKHAQFKEWLYLSVIDELNDDERHLFDLHLGGCSECRSELKELQKFESVIAGNKPVEVTDRLLQEARQQLRVAILEHRLKKTPWGRMFESTREFILQDYRIAFGGIAMSALGLLVGYMIFSQVPKMEENRAHIEPQAVQQAMRSNSGTESFTQGSMRTSNVNLIDANASDGTIEFTFDAITPMHVRGNINDDKVQKVLARALVNEDNPGVRLRTMNAIASQSLEHKAQDPEVKAALISALKGDQNPGVRQEALRVLLRYPLDGEIKQALMYTLMHDKNSGMRIVAINGLAAASVDGHYMDQNILNILKETIQSDNNNYVRRQARTVVEEVTHR
jgi:hypothetical protein